MRLAALLVLAYLAGSVNVAIVLFRFLGKEDPRLKFSGNPGATNVQRLAGRGWAAAVLILDLGRAAALAAVSFALLPPALVSWVALALVAGNRFPCFHGFRGGKGVSAFLGFALPLVPWGAAASCLAWVAVHRIVGIPFVASLTMVLILGGALIALYDGKTTAVLGTAATVALIFFNHRGNMSALARKRQRPEG